MLARQTAAQPGTMNVFLLSVCILSAARYHCNKHVVKMILESAQLLCTAKSICDHDGQQVPAEALGVPKTYKNAHRNHPWSVAVRRSRPAFDWLAALALALCRRYTLIYGKTHASEPLIRALAAASLDNPTDDAFLPQTAVASLPTQFGPTEVPLCMPPACMVRATDGTFDPVASYRRYYIMEKASIAVWKERQKPPRWFRKGIKN